MFIFAEQPLTLGQTVFVRNHNVIFVFCIVLAKSKISESLNLSFHRLVELYVKQQIMTFYR